MSNVLDDCLPGAAATGLRMKTIDRSTHRELHLTVRPLPGERPDETVGRLVSVLHENDACIVRHEIFGAIAAYVETMSALKREFGVTNLFAIVKIAGLASCAPSEAWCLLRGESPRRARNSQPPVSSVGVLQEAAI